MRALHWAGVGTSALFGAALGLIVALVVFAFSATLQAAYPPWATGAPAIGELLALSALATLALAAPMRHERATIGAKCLGAAAIGIVWLCVAGELFGFMHLAGAHAPFYMTVAH